MGWFQETLTNQNFIDIFGAQNMAWFNWILYFALIIAITFVIKEIGLKNTKISSKAKGVISMLIAFMGVTGLMWTLILNNKSPNELFLWVTEIFILTIVGLIIKIALVKNGDKPKFSIQLKTLFFMFAFILINSFHSLLLNDNLLGRNTESLLYDLANTINFQIPIGLYIIIYILSLFFFAKENEPKKEEIDETKKSIKELKKLGAALQSEIKKADKEFDELAKMLHSGMEASRK